MGFDGLEFDIQPIGPSGDDLMQLAGNACRTHSSVSTRRSVGAATSSASFPIDLLLRLVGAVLEEHRDEWQVGWRDFSKESMKTLLEPHD